MKKLLITAACILSSGCLTSRPETYAYTTHDQLFWNGKPFKGTKAQLLTHIKCSCDEQGNDSNRYNQPVEPPTIAVLRGHRNQWFGLGIYLEAEDQTWQRIIFKNFLDTTETVPHIIKIERPSDNNILVLFANNEEELYRIDSLTRTWHFYDGSPIIETKQVKK